MPDPIDAVFNQWIRETQQRPDAMATQQPRTPRKRTMGPAAAKPVLAPVPEPSTARKVAEIAGNFVPGMGEGMALGETVNALGKGNLGGAALAAAGMIPMARRAKKAGEAAESITGIALKTKDGRVLAQAGFDGGHSALVDDLARSRPGNALDEVEEGIERGFVTSSGRYVGRAEGLALAREGRQLRDVSTKHLHASDFIQPKKDKP